MKDNIEERAREFMNNHNTTLVNIETTPKIMADFEKQNLATIKDLREKTKEDKDLNYSLYTQVVDLREKITRDQEAHSQIVDELYKAKEEIKRYKEVVDGIIKARNPYSQEKQYQLWCGFENALDTLIRAKKFQELLTHLNQ